MNGFGASAPINDLFAHFGITEDAVVAAARQRLMLVLPLVRLLVLLLI